MYQETKITVRPAKVGRFCRWHGPKFPVNRDFLCIIPLTNGARILQYSVSQEVAHMRGREKACLGGGVGGGFGVAWPIAFNCGIFSNTQYISCLSHDTRMIGFHIFFEETEREEEKRGFERAKSKDSVQLIRGASADGP